MHRHTAPHRCTDGVWRGRWFPSVGPSVRLSVALLLVAPPVLHAQSDSVRQLRVAIVLLTNSFNKTLTAREIERVHEEVAEFYAFYQRHGAGKVDFDFSLVQIDRRIARNEISEVAPGRYYLARENIEAELVARGFRGRFDEVIALHAWSNANPDRAVQAYGGGAVGPDGRFLGDAGFNSIPSMGRDPNTIGQVLIHEVLHNLDDMFSRSGMADSFLNSDEMSRNMAQLLRERPGAFLPLYADAEMLAFAERERQGREAYPWALQLVYYAWMLERTPKAAWDRLRYGQMVRRRAPAVRALYSSIYTPFANDSVYIVELGRSRLPTRTFTQADFDGSPIYAGEYGAAWRQAPIADSGVVGMSAVIRQRVASIDVEPEIVQYADEPPRPPGARVVMDRCCGPARELLGAALTFRGDSATRGAGRRTVTVTGAASGWYVHPATATFVTRRSWSVADDGPLTIQSGAPVTLNAHVRDDRGRNDVTVRATLLGRNLTLTRSGDGRYSATITNQLPFGLHWARLAATEPGGASVSDSVAVYVRPAGWIRVPQSYAREPDGAVHVTAEVQTRMGETLQQGLPLVAIVGDEARPLLHGTTGYAGFIRAPRAAERVVLASLTGDLQRRVVRLVPGPATYPSPRGATPLFDRVAMPPFQTAVRSDRPIIVDGDLGDWPRTQAAPLRLDARSHLLTDSSVYHGDGDVSGLIRLAWDDSTLYVAGELTDDSVTTGEAWDVDRVNLVFDMKDDTGPVTYAGANPPLEQWQDDDYWIFWRAGGQAVRRFGKNSVDPMPGARLVTRRTAAGWSFEVALPRAALPGYVPFAGQVAGLQVFVTDGDGERVATELMWSARWPYGGDGIEWRLAELGYLLFVDAPLR
jgi:hypothetical protein